MLEMVFVFIFFLYVLPVIVCVVCFKLWGGQIISQSFIPVINLIYAIACCCIAIVIVSALIIEQFPNLIYNYKKILNDKQRK